MAVALPKFLKNMSATQVLGLLAVVVLGYVLYTYSLRKGSSKDSMKNSGSSSNSTSLPPVPTLSQNVPTGGNVEPSVAFNQMDSYATVAGVETTNNYSGKGVSKAVMDPAELLPRDENSEWAKLNPVSTGDLMNVSLLKAGWNHGVNTVGQSLKNANLQLRPDPTIPQMSVGPWNNSTIEPDINRRPLI
jgi:hypothetical protein